MPRVPIRPGASFTVAGIGTTGSGSDAGVDTVRAARLTLTGNPGTLQMRMVGPLKQNKVRGHRCPHRPFRRTGARKSERVERHRLLGKLRYNLAFIG